MEKNRNNFIHQNEQWVCNLFGSKNFLADASAYFATAQEKEFTFMREKQIENSSKHLFNPILKKVFLRNLLLLFHFQYFRHVSDGLMRPPSLKCLFFFLETVKNRLSPDICLHCAFSPVVTTKSRVAFQS